MKNAKLIFFMILLIGILFFLLHASPEMAIRTKVFLMGYPKAALTSDIVDYEYTNMEYNETDGNGYIFIDPPIETATQGILDTYRVKKIAWFYFAGYYKDI